MKKYLLLLLLAGCVQAKSDTITEPEPADDQVPVVEEVTEKESDPVSWSVSAPANVVDAINMILGESGSLPPKEDLVIQANGTKLTVPAGASCDYSMEGESYVVTFHQPRPTIEASAFGFKVHPPLIYAKINPDNTGTATAQTPLGKVTRGFAINWSLSTGAGAEEPPKEGVFRLHTMEDCAPCKKAIEQLEKAKKEGKLPFEYEVTEENVDHISFSRPVLTCKSVGKVWTPVYLQDDPATKHKKGDWRPGWYGIDDAISWWKQVPKK